MALFGKKKNTETNKKIDKLELIGGIVGKLSIISDINVDREHSLETNLTAKQIDEIYSKVNYCIKQIENDENTKNIVSLLNDINIVLHNKINNIPFRDESLQYALIAKDQLECYVKNNIETDTEIEEKIQLIIDYMTSLKVGLNNSITLCKDSLKKSDFDMTNKIENKIKRYELHISIIDKYIETSKKNLLSKVEINMVDDKDDFENSVEEKTEEVEDFSVYENPVSNDADMEKYKEKTKAEIDNELREYRKKVEKEIEKEREQAEQDILKYKRDLRKKYDNEIIQYGTDEQKRIKGALNNNNELSVQDLIESKSNTLTEEKQKEEIESLKIEIDSLLESNEEYKNREQEYVKKINDLTAEIEVIKSDNQENINKRLLEKTTEIDSLIDEVKTLKETNATINQEKTDLDSRNIELSDEVTGLKNNIQFYEEETIRYSEEVSELEEKIKDKDNEIKQLKDDVENHLANIEILKNNEQEYLETIENLETKIQQENETGKTKYLLELEDIKLKSAKENKELQEKINDYEEEVLNLSEQIDTLNSEKEKYLNKELDYKKNIAELEKTLLENDNELEHIKNELNSKLMILSSKDSVIEELEKTISENNNDDIIEQLNNEISELKENSEKEAEINKSKIDDLNNTIISITKDNTDLKNQLDNLKGQTIVMPNVLLMNPYINNTIRQIVEPTKKKLFSAKKNNDNFNISSNTTPLLDVYDYSPVFVERQRETLSFIDKCYCLSNICLLTDGKSYYIGFYSQYDNKKYNNENNSLVRLTNFDEQDVNLFTKEVTEELLKNLDKEKVLQKLSAYYQFIIWYYNKNIADTNLNINDLIEFKKYYNKVVKIIYPQIEKDYRICEEKLIKANKLVILLKLFGTYYEDENEVISEYINNELNNEYECEINNNINNLIRTDIVLPELLQDIQNIQNNISDTINKPVSENNDIGYDFFENETETLKSQVSDNKNTVTMDRYINPSATLSRQENSVIQRPTTIAEKIDNVNVINFNNVKYIVKKQNNNGLVDVSGYSIENKDVAINQYVYMEAFYKEIGIKYNDELIFLFGKNNNTKSVPLLDEREKHINKWDRGAVGEIISFYENSLGKLIAEYER